MTSEPHTWILHKRDLTCTVTKSNFCWSHFVFSSVCVRARALNQPLIFLFECDSTNTIPQSCGKWLTVCDFGMFSSCNWCPQICPLGIPLPVQNTSKMRHSLCNCIVIKCSCSTYMTTIATQALQCLLKQQEKPHHSSKGWRVVCYCFRQGWSSSVCVNMNFF